MLGISSSLFSLSFKSATAPVFVDWYLGEESKTERNSLAQDEGRVFSI